MWLIKGIFYMVTMPHGVPRLFGCWLVSAAALGCSAHSFEQGSSPHRLDQPIPSSVAAADKTTIFIGQDIDSIEGYAANVAEPRGIVSYTSIQGLEGLNSAKNDGGGVMDLARLAQEFPTAPVALGLYLVGALDAINQGSFDASLDLLGDQLASYSVPILLRVGYEFDGPWNHYDPQAYQQAFIRLRQHLAARGATTVEYVWQSSASCGNTFGQNPVEAWYPGDEYVDWIAASYFAQSACQFSPVKHMLYLAREHRKPFMIAEATPQGYDLASQTFSTDGFTRAPKTASEIYGEWYAPYFQFIADNLDVVRAVTYINADWDSQALWGPPYSNGYFGDSRVQANTELLSQWHDALSVRHFQ